MLLAFCVVHPTELWTLRDLGGCPVVSGARMHHILSDFFQQITQNPVGSAHKPCRFGGAPTQSTGHNNLALTRLTQFFTPVHVSQTSTCAFNRTQCFSPYLWVIVMTHLLHDTVYAIYSMSIIDQSIAVPECPVVVIRYPFHQVKDRSW